ncbi:myocardin isoform X1 [Electrophorus electricus]|uniref:myocardin isoform X1 n=1 Tax=Electrophorus electricus TaxID=8005 RepID=UPI0015D03A83|nr:myocardin isoform X1 [Electrophorus electricus]
MTLLASERSLLIRSKFRSVLQLRIQNRRQQKELCGESAAPKASCPDQAGEKEVHGVVHQTVDGTTQKSPPKGLTAETAQDRASGGPQKQKKARLVEDLSEKIQRRPGPLELLQKHILPLENAPICFALASDVFEDDVSPCSSASPEQLGLHQSPGFSSSPGLSSDHSLSDGSPGATPTDGNSSSVQQPNLALLPATESLSQPVTMTVVASSSMATTGKAKGMCISSQTTPVLPKTAHSILGGSLVSPRPPRPRKPRDCKPKMRKLKYHQYIPPDQRGGAGGGPGNSSQKNNSQSQPIDPAYSRLLQQQQVFLQLQILNQHQQLPVATSSENQLVRFSGAVPQSCPRPVPPAANPTPLETSPTQKIELLPPNLDDLTVSELRQQLRKRGLPVSGTKPALLERLRPFQMPRPQLTPPPLCHLEGTLVSPCPPGLTPSNVDVSSSPSHVYVQPSGMAQQGSAGVGYLTSSSSSAGSSPSLQAPSPPQPLGALWRPDQAAEELSVELEMRERIRCRPREKIQDAVTQPCGGTLHPFLQQDAGCLRRKPNTEGQVVLWAQQAYSCQPCDTIGQDFELPLQITASPEQAPPTGGRSLEELLQEAIQRVQMEPSESIDDILEGTVGSSDFQLPGAALPGSPTPPPDQLQPTQGTSKDDRVLSSPLCSSLLLELPPSPTGAPPLSSNPAPPPPPLPFCTTPPLCTASRKRRSDVPAFDPADWLESLTSGLHPLTPPTAPFVEIDLGLDSDLNVNRVLDLMVEQW